MYIRVHAHNCLEVRLSLRAYTLRNSFMKHLEIKTLAEHCCQVMGSVSSKSV